MARFLLLSQRLQRRWHHGVNDMPWQDGSTGDVYMWFMDGTTINSGGYVEQGIPSDWSIY
ncbi:MAG: hypothetical protein SFH39_05360 [Candidatus Magnetobacterium sp. LHC-1]|uniref:Uncharacterized protein n=1 Tax=Candidatus Magnetobacterium casense TaxID=1455061 RepID=A0ABS6S0W6_9BACT|nr:hypothetical protein [Candidatus Magnetobacterium casensis]MBF0608558.1 hypothetical protein [Nitrospirota bacterium]MBV6342497.1 hypothetical protein [Candidatus Magnetobacterium casensis]